MSDYSWSESFNDMKEEQIDNMQSFMVNHEQQQIFEQYSSGEICDKVKFQDLSQDEEDILERDNSHQVLQKSVKLEAKRSKSVDHHEFQTNIKRRVHEKISQFDNKTLYPELMGPHPLYALENDETLTKKSNLVDLKQKLQEYVKSWISKKNKNKSFNKIVQKRIGAKYNKYSLQFKLKTVKKIQQQIMDDGENAKSLRYYIVKQASLLKIHPKNITRWFQTKDLQNKQGGRKAKYPILEFRLAKFIKKNPQCKRKQVVQQAKKILSQMGDGKEFNFSKGWYERFRVRLKQQKVNRSIKDILPQLLQQNDQQQIKVQKLESLLSKESYPLINVSNNKSVQPFQIIKVKRNVKKQDDE